MHFSFTSHSLAILNSNNIEQGIGCSVLSIIFHPTYYAMPHFVFYFCRTQTLATTLASATRMVTACPCLTTAWRWPSTARPPSLANQTPSITSACSMKKASVRPTVLLHCEGTFVMWRDIRHVRGRSLCDSDTRQHPMLSCSGQQCIASWLMWHSCDTCWQVGWRLTNSRPSPGTGRQRCKAAWPPRVDSGSSVRSLTRIKRLFGLVVFCLNICEKEIVQRSSFACNMLCFWQRY